MMYDAGTYRSVRSAPQLQEKLPVEVRTFAHNGGGLRYFSIFFTLLFCDYGIVFLLLLIQWVLMFLSIAVLCCRYK